MAEVHGQRDAGKTRGGRGATASANGNLVFDVNAQGRNLAILRVQHLTIGCDDEVIFHAAANLSVAALGGNEEIGGALGPKTEIEIEREGRGIEGGAEVGRSRRQCQAYGAASRNGT